MNESNLLDRRGAVLFFPLLNIFIRQLVEILDPVGGPKVSGEADQLEI